MILIRMIACSEAPETESTRHGDEEDRRDKNVQNTRAATANKMSVSVHLDLTDFRA